MAESRNVVNLQPREARPAAAGASKRRSHQASEEAHCAGCMNGAGCMNRLEFELWDAVVTAREVYFSAFPKLPGVDVFDHVEEESLSPIDKWEKPFPKWRQDTGRDRY